MPRIEKLPSGVEIIRNEPYKKPRKLVFRKQAAGSASAAPGNTLLTGKQPDAKFRFVRNLVK